MRRRPYLALTALLAISSCSSPPDATPTSAGTADPEPSSAVAEPSPSAAATTAATVAPSGDPPAIALDIVADGLIDPINITATPEGWLLVNERDGRVMAVNPADGQVTIALDITDGVQGGGEQGLLGFAVHPEWPDVPRAFVHYSERATGDTVLSELSGSPGTVDTPPTFDASSERVLLEVEQPAGNHNGGQLAFGPDGYLYLGLGDGGGANDQYGNGQNPSTLLGSILRLDVSTPGTRAIPADNPFVDGGGAPEVFLYGLRNPWRFSFDRETELLWIADVGQDAFEEVNRLDTARQSGANLGWNVMEASHCFADADCSAEGLVLPLTEYDRDFGCSVTGGYVYRGDAVPGLDGWYLFADYCRGLIFGVRADAEPAEGSVVVTPVILIESGLQVSAFGEGVDGELYVADLEGGDLYRVTVGP